MLAPEQPRDSLGDVAFTTSHAVRGPARPVGGEERDGGDTAGRLEEELGRMSAIADVIRPGALLLCNESLASTNEREGAALARQIVETVRDCGITVVYVTHMYELARGLADADDPAAVALRTGAAVIAG